MKGMLQILGVRDVKNMHSVDARSIPKVQRSSYLTLYMLRLEKDRLEKEVFMLNKRRSALDMQLDNIRKRIERLQKEVHEEEKIKNYKGIPSRPLKTISINY